MPQIAVINSSAADDAEVAFAAKAVDAQLREDFCPRWPDVPYSPVTFFSSKKDLPVASGLSMIFSIVDNWDDPGSSAWHSWAGVPFVQIGRGMGELSELLSHEAVELCVNPRCDRVFVLPDGSTAAHEVADPVQAFTYTKTVSIMGEARGVVVSGFALPSYFTGAGRGPHFYSPGFAFDLQPGAIAPGGYLPILGPNGWEPRFGHGTRPELIAKKALNPTSRAAQRRNAR